MKRKSFSLIEVVLACTVIILFLMAGVILTTSALKNVRVGLHRMTATMLAKDTIENINKWRDDNYFNNNSSFDLVTAGTIPMPNDTVSRDAINFTRQTFRTNIVGTATKFTVNIGWNDYGQLQTVTMSTYLNNWQSF